jgi:hypothetical protein
MKRLFQAATLVLALLTLSSAQDIHIGTLPPEPPGGTGEVIDALIVGAEMIGDGQVMFLVPQDAPHPNLPIPPPSLVAKVDGKVVRAFGVDGKPLENAELKKRLPTWTAVVVVPSDLDLPDRFYMKVLNERTVTFMVPKKLLIPMARASRARRKSDGPRPQLPTDRGGIQPASSPRGIRPTAAVPRTTCPGPLRGAHPASGQARTHRCA